jgi:nucleoside-diphosphate-sugar epimerase
MQQQKTALVLGANGGIGGEVARQLLAAGWQVRALSRRPMASQVADGIDWVQGDAMSAADVRHAARGCSVIVHAVNPAGYRNWSGQVVPMLNNTIAAAESENALVLLPGTIYNYGPDAFPLLHEASPQHPRTRKGALRVEMEGALAAFSERGGRALIVRAGDYFGPRAANNWFSQGLVKPGRPIARVANPGQAGVGHTWAYLPDVAAAMVALIERRASLPPFARFHLAGHWDPDGSAMTGAIVRVAARRGLQVRSTSFPWWMLRLAAPFNETLRELGEMRYLWQQAVRLDNASLVKTLGAEPHTALDEAVERTLEGLGCLPHAASMAPA